jgi:hypothetical protein
MTATSISRETLSTIDNYLIQNLDGIQTVFAFDKTLITIHNWNFKKTLSLLRKIYLSWNRCKLEQQQNTRKKIVVPHPSYDEIPFVKLDKCSLTVNIDDEIAYTSDITEQTDKLDDDILKLKMRYEQELTDLKNKHYELANKNVMTKKKMKLHDTSMQFIDDMF